MRGKLERNNTSSKACFKPKRPKDREEKQEQRNCKPQARPRVLDTCSRMHLQTCLAFCIKEKLSMLIFNWKVNNTEQQESNSGLYFKYVCILNIIRIHKQKNHTLAHPWFPGPLLPKLSLLHFNKKMSS